MSGQSAAAGPGPGATLATRLRRWSSWVRQSNGWRRRGIAFGAGLLSVLAFAPVFAWPVLFLTLPVLVWLIDSAEAPHAAESRARTWAGRALDRALIGVRPAFLDGWWWGFGFFFASVVWIGEAFLVEADKFAWALPFAITLMPAGLALFTATSTAVMRSWWRPGAGRLLVFALVWGLTEWVRGHILTGFPWNTLGYALTGPLTLMQSASLFGIYGLSLIAGLIFAAPLVVAAGEDDNAPDVVGGWWRGAAVSAGGLALLALFGAWRLMGNDGAMVEGVQLRIVQPSVPQRDKWRTELQREIFDLHLALSRSNAAGTTDNLAGVSHVIWPEAAMPFRPLEHPEALAAIGALLPAGAHLLAGGLRAVWPEGGGARPGIRPKVYNSLFVFGAGGALSGLYDKIQLVPFGEYLPYQQQLEALGLRQLSYLPGGLSAGLKPRALLQAGRLPAASVLICYESIFPGEVVQGPERPGVIVSATNDGWFGDSTGPRQHFHQARVRAVEEGVPLVRAANNGISAIVDPYGRVLQALGMNVKGVIDTGLPRALPPPVYARIGDSLFWIGSLVLVVALGVLPFGANRRRMDRSS